MPPRNPFAPSVPASAGRSRSLTSFTSRLLHENRRAFERWMGEPLEPPILGCGNYGCVVMGGSGEKLLKLTVDPAEPLLARLIGDLQREDSARGEMLRGGVVKLYRVARLRGVSWRYRRKAHPVYAVVREAVIPIEESVSQSRSDPIAAWIRRKRRGKRAARQEVELQLQTSMDWIDLNGDSFMRPPGWVSTRTQDLLDDIVETLEAADKGRTKRTRARIEAQALSKMADLASYPEGETLGEAMIALLAGFDVPLRDVHVGNVGLRTSSPFASVQSPSLVLYDFGHAELRRVPAQDIEDLEL